MIVSDVWNDDHNGGRSLIYTQWPLDWTVLTRRATSHCPCIVAATLRSLGLNGSTPGNCSVNKYISDFSSPGYCLNRCLETVLSGHWLFSYSLSLFFRPTSLSISVYKHKHNKLNYCVNVCKIYSANRQKLPLQSIV